MHLGAAWLGDSSSGGATGQGWGHLRSWWDKNPLLSQLASPAVAWKPQSPPPFPRPARGLLQRLLARAQSASAAPPAGPQFPARPHLPWACPGFWGLWEAAWGQGRGGVNQVAGVSTRICLAGFPFSKQSTRTRQKPQYLWWPSLGCHTPSLPRYSVGRTGQRWFRVWEDLIRNMDTRRHE